MWDWTFLLKNPISFTGMNATCGFLTTRRFQPYFLLLFWTAVIFLAPHALSDSLQPSGSNHFWLLFCNIVSRKNSGNITNWKGSIRWSVLNAKTLPAPGNTRGTWYQVHDGRLYTTFLGLLFGAILSQAKSVEIDPGGGGYEMCCFEPSIITNYWKRSIASCF
jgi:hypothetical protein